MLRIAVVEDETAFQEQMKTYLERYGKETNKEIKVDFFETGKEFEEGYRPIYDILLMDIQMPGVDGMTAAEHIRRVDKDVVIVFITNLAQYAIKGYEVGALDYILKPVAYEVFKMKFARAVGRCEARSGGQVVLNTGNGMKRIRTNQIYFVEVQKHFLHYHTTEGEIVVRGTMQNAEKILSEHHFAKCNHWYLVNLLQISEIGKSSVIVAGVDLEISRRSRSAFLEAAASCLGGTI